MAVIDRYFDLGSGEEAERRFRDLGDDWAALSADPDLFIALRKDYANVYFEGNSLAHVSFRKSGASYTVKVHQKFARLMDVTDPVRQRLGARAAQLNVAEDAATGYVSLSLDSADVRAMFARNALKSAKAFIRENLRSAELTREQEMIRATPPTDDFLIIDRQIEDSEGARSGHPLRMDLLGLKCAAGDAYRLVLIEIKLADNAQLRRDLSPNWQPSPGGDNDTALTQLASYVDRIADPVIGAEYARCYERQFAQKRRLGLLPGLSRDGIEILTGRPLSVVLVTARDGGPATTDLRRRGDRSHERIFDWHGGSVADLVADLPDH